MPYFCRYCKREANTTAYFGNCKCKGGSPDGYCKLEVYVCKFCGHEANSIKDLIAGNDGKCPNSPTGKHQPYEGK